MTIDLIVPTVEGREASLERCLESFDRFTDEALNEIIIRDPPTCGEGWIEGLERSKSPYVALVADDLEVISENWAEVCISTVDRGLLPCPRVYGPDLAIESQGGDMNAYQHVLARHTKDSAEVDFTTVPFCSREQIDRIGMLPIHYGSDVWVSHRGRQLGYETILRHGWDLIHHRESPARGAGMTQDERDAMDTQTMREELARHG